jgi:fatty acid desaturase
MGIIVNKWYGLANMIAGFIFIYIFMWLDNWLATVYVICSMVWVIFGWIIFDESLMEKLNDKRNTKRLNRNRTNNRMGKSCIKYK